MSRRSKPSDNVEQILMEGDKRNNFISKKKNVYQKYSSTMEKNKMRTSKKNAENEERDYLSGNIQTGLGTRACNPRTLRLRWEDCFKFVSSRLHGNTLFEKISRYVVYYQT